MDFERGGKKFICYKIEVIELKENRLNFYEAGPWEDPFTNNFPTKLVRK